PQAISNSETDGDPPIKGILPQITGEVSRLVLHFRRSLMPGYNARRKLGGAVMSNATTKLSTLSLGWLRPTEFQNQYLTTGTKPMRNFSFIICLLIGTLRAQPAEITV